MDSAGIMLAEEVFPPLLETLCNSLSVKQWKTESLDIANILSQFKECSHLINKEWLDWKEW